MHSFEVDIRIYQPENSEHHFRGLTNPDGYRKRMHQLACYMTLSLFLVLFKIFSYYKKMLVAVFLGYNQYWPGGWMFYV